MDEWITLLFEGRDDLFEERLSAMAPTRENAEKLLDAIDCYDVPALYRELVYTYDGVLTADELAAVRRRYDERFDIPL